jgi:hypothetical protein
MAIEFKCPACGEQLRVANEHAGKIARCPQCQAETPVPWASSTTPPPPSAADLGFPSGPRSAPSDEAARAFELFGSAAPRSSPGGSSGGSSGGGGNVPYFGAPSSSSNPYSSPGQPGFRKYPKDSRGQTIVILAVVSYASCFLCGLIGVIPACISWAMAQQDLADIQLGLVDPNSEGAVKLGRILSIIYLVLSLIGFVIFVGMLALAIVADAAK